MQDVVSILAKILFPASTAMTDSLNTARTIYFAEFEVQPQQRVLRANGEMIPLGSRAFDLLLAFVENPGVLLRKDELIERVWPRVIVEENNLQVQVLALRRVLGRGAIATIPGHGYQFALPLRDHATPGLVATSPEPELSERGVVASDRRQATLLKLRFCNLVEPGVPFDPEAMDEILGAIEAHACTVLERQGGTLMQCDMQGIACLFGLPMASENAVMQAMETAFELMAEARKRPGLAGSPTWAGPSLGGAIASAHVVATAGARPGSWRLSGTLWGTTSALCEAADGNEVLLSDELHAQLAPYFDATPHAAVRVDYLSEPIRVHSVRGRSGIATRIDAARWRGFTPFVGRRAELDILHRALAAAAEGNGQFVLVTGDAGMGKSRLLDEFKNALDSEVLQLHGRCQSHDRVSAYAPFVDLLRRLLQVEDAEDPEQQIVQALCEMDASLESCIPGILHLLSIDSLTHALQPGLEGGPKRQLLADAVLGVLTLAAQHYTVVLFLDDWHFADDASVGMLQQVVQVCPSHRLMIVVTARPNSTVPWPRHDASIQVFLKPLDRAQSAGVVRSVVGAETVPGEVLDMILARAEGNPFFIEESCWTLVGAGILAVRDGCVHIQGELQAADLPGSVEAVIRTRLDQLPADALALIKLVCVFGREFLLRDLLLLAPPALGLTAALERLVDEALLQSTQVVPERVYRFRHALTHLVAYESLLMKQRRDTHQRIGMLLLDRHRDAVDEHLDQIAYHFLNSGDCEHAVAFALKAAGRATQQAAFSIAAQHLRNALGLLEKDSDPQNASRLLYIYANLANLLVLLQGYAGEEVARVHARARDLIRQPGVGDPRLSAAWTLWRYYYNRSHLADAGELALRMIDMAESRGHASERLVAFTAQGVVETLSGNFLDACSSFDHALTHFDIATERELIAIYGISPAVTALSFSGLALNYLGEFPVAEERCRRSSAVATELGHPGSQALAHFYRGAVHQMHGDLPRMKAENDALVELATRHGFPHWLALGRMGVGYESMRAGRLPFETAFAMMNEGAEGVIAMGVDLLTANYHTVAVEMLVARGQDAQARVHMRIAEQAARVLRATHVDTEVVRAHGLLALREDPLDALRHFVRASDASRACGARLQELRLALDIASVLVRLQRIPEATGALQTALEGLPDSEHSPLVQHARHQLGELVRQSFVQRS